AQKRSELGRSPMNMKRAAAAASALFLSAAISSVSFAAGGVEGGWEVTHTDRKPFEITLAAGGKASANRPPKPMTGTWKESGNSAVITWDTGWTTKITKEGGKFTKTAFEKGKADTPANSSPAEKVK